MSFVTANSFLKWLFIYIGLLLSCSIPILAFGGLSGLAKYPPFGEEGKLVDLKSGIAGTTRYLGPPSHLKFSMLGRAPDRNTAARLKQESAVLFRANLTVNDIDRHLVFVIDGASRAGELSNDKNAIPVYCDLENGLEALRCYSLSEQTQINVGFLEHVNWRFELVWVHPSIPKDNWLSFQVFPEDFSRTWSYVFRTFLPYILVSLAMALIPFVLWLRRSRQRESEQVRSAV